MSAIKKFQVTIDSDLESIAPGYLQNRVKDIAEIKQSLEKGDFDTIRILAHRMKGSGAGYGFDGITDIGRRMEVASKEQNAMVIAEAVEELAVYVAGVEMVFE
ncbi:MAG: Hpt domain-containing protein [Magnetococcales bacterium]|nr:Hpt domain-containing protein [Magnetococcales bacterium]